LEQSYQIPRTALVWVLLAVLAVLAPQAIRMPLWITVIALCCIAWRWLIYQGRLSYPGKLQRVGVVLFTLAVSASQLRAMGIGLDSAASLLALGFVFKLIEMRQKRDIYVVIALCFVMIMVAFLYSQGVLVTLYLLLCVLLGIIAMVSLNRSAHSNDARGSAVLGIKILAQAAPLMILLFFLFPRIAPLWAVPVQAGSGETGVSDEMSPGDISQLGRSGDLAFRVQFENSAAPDHARMYWRGLVLDDFDNATWRRSRSRRNYTLQSAFSDLRWRWSEAVTPQSEPVRYNVIMEATQQPWIYGLHMSATPGRRMFQNPNFEIFNESRINQQLSYDLDYYGEFLADPQLSDRSRRQNLTLPETGNSRSREFAQQLRAATGGERAFIQSVLNYYSANEFFYRLDPAPLGSDRIDEFLFQTLEGFCEHYASSFTYLMRAAGIPARVVVGYQGAEYNRYEDYWMVYQYNAHAWSEVWLEGAGWVRIDPTAAVAPERIELGVEAALGNDPSFRRESFFSTSRLGSLNWFNSLRLRLDALEYEWNRRVVNYDEGAQVELLTELFGEINERGVLVLLTVLAAGVIVAVGFTVIQMDRPPPRSKLNKLFEQFDRELSKAGLSRRPGEGPYAYRNRVLEARPDLAEPVSEFTRYYVHYAYVDDANKGDPGAGALRLMRQTLQELARTLRSG
jgi:transglutaminase-like putative cysteine protease